MSLVGDIVFTLTLFERDHGEIGIPNACLNRSEEKPSDGLNHSDHSDQCFV